MGSVSSPRRAIVGIFALIAGSRPTLQEIVNFLQGPGLGQDRPPHLPLPRGPRLKAD